MSKPIAKQDRAFWISVYGVVDTFGQYVVALSMRIEKQIAVLEMIDRLANEDSNHGNIGCWVFKGRVC